jgi:hypothetical protein
MYPLNGYTCEKCGAWVPNGTYHYCQPYTPWATNPQPIPTGNSPVDYFRPYLPVLERIAAALELIAKEIVDGKQS